LVYEEHGWPIRWALHKRVEMLIFRISGTTHTNIFADVERLD
jgi:hypothetical protein